MQTNFNGPNRRRFVSQMVGNSWQILGNVLDPVLPFNLVFFFKCTSLKALAGGLSFAWFWYHHLCFSNL